MKIFRLPWLRYIWKGHVVNWFWRERACRRRIREDAKVEYMLHPIKKYIPYVENLKITDADANKSFYDTGNDEKVFSFWVQGEKEAPDIVRKCVSRMRSHFGDRFIFLDNNNISDYITLPQYIIEKFNEGKISYAHYSDIIRLELLYCYGGYWFDSTCLLTGEIPENIKNSNFLVFMTWEGLFPFTLIQNFFIRAKKGDYLLKMWRDLVYHYWKNEQGACNYFLPHILFRLLVTYNYTAKEEFKKMPKISLEPTHLFWWKLGNLPFDKTVYDDMREKAFFQKTTYRNDIDGVNEIIPGSFADYLLNHE